MRYGRLACHGGPDDSLTRARDGAHPAHMIPAVIGVVLVILLWASLVADGEEDERREAAGDGEPSSWSWRSRVGAMAGFIVLMPLGLLLTFPEVLFTDGPAWWWLWLAGAVAYGAFLVVAAQAKADGDARHSADDEAILHGDLGAILRRQMPGAADTDPVEH